MGEEVVRGSRQLSPTDGGSVYAAVVASRARPQQPSGPHKPFVKGADNSKSDALSEATIGHMYLADLSRPLCGTTLNSQVAINSVTLLSERPNKTPIFVSGVTDMHNFLQWLKALSPSSPSYQIKGEKLMTVP